MIRKAIFLAAGRGSRFQPLSNFIPKELLPLFKTPLIGYLLQEVAAVKVEEVILVSSPQKEALDRYFVYRAEELGLSSTIVYQSRPAGTADAVWRVKNYVEDEPFFLYYCDELYLSDLDEDGVQRYGRSEQLLAAYLEVGASIISLLPVEKRDVERFGIARIDRPIRTDLLVLAGVVEKPQPSEAPSLLASVSGMVLGPDVFWALREILKRDPSGGEFYLTNALNLLAQTSGARVHGCVLTGGEWVDIGTLDMYPSAFKRVADWELKRAVC